MNVYSATYLPVTLRLCHYQMLAFIRELYDVEREAKEEDLDAVGMVKLRQRNSKPILTKIHSHLEEWSGQVLPKSPMGKAITYTLGQWIANLRLLSSCPNLRRDRAC